MIVGDGIMLGVGGESANIFVTGLSETDTVSATKDGNAISGKWISGSESGRFTDGHPECIVSAADSLLYTYNGRNYKKAYAGDAYAAYFYVYYAELGVLLMPLLVAKTSDAVAYKTDGNYESVQHSQSTITYKGETWYISADGAAYVSTEIPPTANVVNINAIAGVSSFSTREEAALALLEYAVPHLIDGFDIAPIKSYGIWRVSNGDNTRTADVLVDAAAEFEVTL